MNRDQATELGRQTVRILEAGQYVAPSNTVVPIAELVRRAVAGTCSYPPDVSLPPSHRRDHPAAFEVENETTLVAARRLAVAGLRPAALNFASARKPGGGFLTGARAQEESLARSSGLYACLRDNPMYSFHQGRRDPLYTHYVLYSPDVPVFRSDDGALLEQPYLCSFLTSPAPNAKVVRARDPSRRGEIREALRERMGKVLAIAVRHGHEVLVLGAWGCGVFGNDPEEVAGLFRQALTGPFRGAFRRIVFAVLDGSADGRMIEPFRRAFL